MPDKKIFDATQPTIVAGFGFTPEEVNLRIYEYFNTVPTMGEGIEKVITSPTLSVGMKYLLMINAGAIMNAHKDVSEKLKEDSKGSNDLPADNGTGSDAMPEMQQAQDSSDVSQEGSKA